MKQPEWSKRIKAHDEDKLAEFMQRMANRLVVAKARYGTSGPDKGYFRRLQAEVRAYKRTGNVEHLFNIANYAALEWLYPEAASRFDATVDSVTRGMVGQAEE